MYHILADHDEDRPYGDTASGWCDCGAYVIDTYDGWVDRNGSLTCE
jgi:hypothetical protein